MKVRLCIKSLFSAIIIFTVYSYACMPLFSEQIIFNADKMTGTAGNNNDTTTLQGNAFVQTQNMEIRADRITLSGTDFRLIKAEGKKKKKNTENQTEFSCGKLSFDRETEVTLLQDNVKLEDKENEVSASSQLLEYRQKTQTAIFQINVKLTQKDNVCTGAYAVYHKNEQLLEISGSPKIVQGKDTFNAQQITLDMNTQEISMSGRVHGSVTSSGKKPEKEE